jgi:hypothetical protein
MRNEISKGIWISAKWLEGGTFFNKEYKQPSRTLKAENDELTIEFEEGERVDSD